MQVVSILEGVDGGMGVVSLAAVARVGPPIGHDLLGKLSPTGISGLLFHKLALKRGGGGS